MSARFARRRACLTCLQAVGRGPGHDLRRCSFLNVANYSDSEGFLRGFGRQKLGFSEGLSLV